MKELNNFEKKLIDDYLIEGEKATYALEHLETKELIRMLRTRLFLTQANLAKIAKVTPSTILRIETGHMEPTEKMLKKIFSAMHCEMMVIPKTSQHPVEILRKKAHQIALKRVESHKKSKIYKKHKDDKKWLNEMLECEIQEILKKPSKIWEIDS